MKKNKIILDHCPNFYKISNFEFDEEDTITLKLINIYSDYIFDINIKDESELKKIEDLDYILSKYVDDYSFRKEIQGELLKVRVKSDGNIIDTIVNSILKIFKKYQEGYTRNIYFSRWV